MSARHRSTVSRSKTLLRLAMMSVACLATGCSVETTTDEALEQTFDLQLDARLVDRLHPGLEVAFLPAATLQKDRRLVLRAAPARDWMPVEVVRAFESDRPLVVRLPDELVDRGGLAVRARADGHDRRGDGPTIVALRVLARRDAGRVLVVEVPESLDGRAGILQARVETPRASPSEAIGIAGIGWREGARLRFAIGAEAPGSAIDYRIESCSPAGCSEVHAEQHAPDGQWHDRVVRLEGPADQRTLRFVTRAAAGTSGGQGLWANPSIWSPAAREDEARADVRPRNLILVSLDTLGARHMSAYGHVHETTPFLEAYFSEHGVLVERFIASEVHTGPSHMSLFTSLPPSAHGVVSNALMRLPYTVDTLASNLRESGRLTGAVTENVALYLGGGFGRGFDEYRELTPQLEDHDIRKTLAAARSWLERNDEHPFFLFVHTYETHWTYEPPPEYRDHFEATAPPRHPQLEAEFSPRRYDQEIRFVDDRMRAFFDFLGERDLLDDTLVVVTSDHGEAFLEHGQLGHGAQVHGEVTEIPLLLAGPGIPAARRIRSTLAQIDLAPTLLELLGARPLRDAQGRSFADWLRAAESDDPRAAFSEAWFGTGRVISNRGVVGRVPHDGPSYAIEVGGEKVIRLRSPEGFHYQHFLIDEDPGELRDLSERSLSSFPALREQLDRYVAESERTLHALRARERSAVEGSGTGDVPALDRQRLEGLRALGYIEDDEAAP